MLRWLHYVDDTFTTLHKDEIDDFHEHLNRQNAHIQFTKEIEDNGKIPCLSLGWSLSLTLVSSFRKLVMGLWATRML